MLLRYLDPSSFVVAKKFVPMNRTYMGQASNICTAGTST